MVIDQDTVDEVKAHLAAKGEAARMNTQSILAGIRKMGRLFVYLHGSAYAIRSYLIPRFDLRDNINMSKCSIGISRR